MTSTMCSAQIKNINRSIRSVLFEGLSIAEIDAIISINLTEFVKIRVLFLRRTRISSRNTKQGETLIWTARHTIKL